MKRLIMSVSLLFGVVVCQRPTYAGSQPIHYPSLANRFKETINVTTTTEVSLPNRFGTNNDSNQRIPLAAMGDSQLVDRLNKWPEQNRPFWLLNADHIERHRGVNNSASQNNGSVINRNNNTTVPLVNVNNDNPGAIENRNSFGIDRNRNTGPITTVPNYNNDNYHNNNNYNNDHYHNYNNRDRLPPIFRTYNGRRDGGYYL